MVINKMDEQVDTEETPTYTDFEIEMLIEEENEANVITERKLEQAYWILLDNNLIPAGHKNKVMPMLYQLYE